MDKQKQYFGTDGIRGKVGNAVINPEFVLKLGWAVGKVLGSSGQGTVLIGKDTRVSGYMLESALEAGLSAAGMNIRLLGPMPTPGIAYLTRTFRAEAGIVISASHNRFQDNGIKFFGSDGRKLSDEVEFAIEDQVQKAFQVVPSSALGKASRITDAPGRYIEYCKGSVQPQVDLRGFTIVLDCAHGANYQIAPAVFRELGATIIELGVDPDGFNINDGCGSTHPEFLKKTVLLTHADIGIAFDGDGDRVVMVDHQGNLVDGDQILYVIANYLHQRGILEGGVVGTVMSNLGLEQALANIGIPFKRAQVGDRNVLEELVKLNWSLGGEASGHIICLQKSTTGDGIISALQVLAAMKKSDKKLSELCANMSTYPQTLINVPIGEIRADLMQDLRLKQLIANAKAQLAPNGRVLLRMSGTEPVVRVMVEGDDAQLVEKTAEFLAESVREIT